MSLEACVRLNAAVGIGPHRFQRLVRAFGSPAAALGATAEAWAKALHPMGLPACGQALRSALALDVMAEIARCADMGATLVRLGDEGYPVGLQSLEAPPPLLYVRGRLMPQDALAVAVVGTRTPSPYGRDQARRLAYGLAREGLTVVSGLARGVDTLAHRAALSAGGRTVAVLGQGLARVYPPENAPLAEAICGGRGAVVSQFALDAAPDKFRFPMRNAVISGLALGVLVAEGEEDSGSLITAGLALEQGRDVYAVPGPADSPLSMGPLRLIQQGAKLVLAPHDVLDELPAHVTAALVPPPEPAATPDWLPAEPAPRPKAPAHARRYRRAGADDGAPAGDAAPRPGLDLRGDEAVLHGLLRGKGRLAFDRLADAAGLPPGRLAATLTVLEIKGAVVQHPGKVFEAL